MGGRMMIFRGRRRKDKWIINHPTEEIDGENLIMRGVDHG